MSLHESLSPASAVPLLVSLAQAAVQAVDPRRPAAGPRLVGRARGVGGGEHGADAAIGRRPLQQTDQYSSQYLLEQNWVI